ncbi:hypothetical protein BASA61_002074 [Batrachochytrium salamandrivorans]|nr:hypothetical protein BASA61_002074 [Batrachochytrium salamandrivorans]
MQSFSEGNDAIRLNQIDLTGSTMLRQNKGKTTGAFSSAGISQSSSQNILHSSVHPAKTDEKGDLAKIEKSTGNALLFDRNCIFLNREKENLISDFKMCQSGIVLPDRKKGWAVHCLTVAIPRSKSVVDNHIEDMKLNACLTLDAWSNIRSKPIVNYMLISDSSTFFLKSVFDW